MNPTEYRYENLPPNMIRKIRIVPSGCWEWQGGINSSGYGVVWIGIACTLTHRTAYELFVGSIPDGHQIDHLCRNTICCNPAHLEPVTARENMQRRPDVGKSHCKHGHEMTEGNTMIKKRAGGLEQRNCRECERVAQRRRRQAVAA